MNGTEYTVPEKECISPEADDPCSMFKHMAFPVDEFYPPALSDMDRAEKPDGGGCGCGRR